MSDVAVSRLHFPVTTLGPGKRIGLWLQGCSIRCPGCVSVDTWEPGTGLLSLETLVAELVRQAPNADGLTISGGEPFDQPDGLAEILRAWREISDGSVLVFTGYERPALADWLLRNPGLIDAVMTGPFRSELPQTLALRGSDNQELHILTPLGEMMAAYERPLETSDSRLDVLFDVDGYAWFAGIPARGDMGRLRRALVAQGHYVETSDMLRREWLE